MTSIKNNHDHGPFKVSFTEDGINYRDAEISDPVPVGQQLLMAAGIPDVENYSLFAILPNGEFEDIRLDETFDVRSKGTERFAYFETDRSYSFTIENRQMTWGRNLISGKTLRALANVGSQYTIYLEVRGGHDKPIGDTDLVDLSGKGIERFITMITETTEGLGALPSADRQFLEGQKIDHEVALAGGVTGLILKDFPLPPGKFDHEKVDVMFLLPPGYPDASVDMFYTRPWIRLTLTSGYAKCADVPHQFGTESWQRWSRHAEWRPGIDGVRTMIARAHLAFEKAS